MKLKYSSYIPTKNELQILIALDFSSYEIARHFLKSSSSIQRLLNKYNLKTKFKYREGGYFFNRGCRLFKERNWKEIQDFYNQNHSWAKTSIEFKISQHTLVLAGKKSYLKSRPLGETMKIVSIKHPYKHSKKMKLLLSEKRKNYLSKNSDKPAWKSSNKNYSIACEQLKQKFKDLNINFTEEFQPLLHKRRFFSVDIAFPEKKIGLEINGGQHYDTDGNLKPYYQNRHNLICEDGWTLEEIKYHKAFDLKYILDILNKHNLITKSTE